MITPIDQYAINAVRKERRVQKISQAMLAYGIGVSCGFIGQAESPKCDIKYSMNHIHEIAKYLRLFAARFSPRKTALKQTVMRLRRLTATLLLLFSYCAAHAQNPVGIAYYDLDHLYDTSPALFYNDTDYTPEGRLHWTSERYERKVRGIAAVIDSLSLPLIALNGVENEAVVRDIAKAVKGDYTYLHRTLNTLGSMDFALLYYGDRFFPDYDQTGRGWLYVEGELLIPPIRKAFPNAKPPTSSRKRIGLLLVRDTRSAVWAVEQLREERAGVKLVVAGRASSINCKAAGLVDATMRAAKAGRGNVRARSGWYMRDKILVDTTLTVIGADVFARSYLVDAKTGYPASTYEKRVYKGGVSYALPVFVYIR